MSSEQESDLLMFGSRVALDLFAENYQRRGDLRRLTVIQRAERARALRKALTRWGVA